MLEDKKSLRYKSCDIRKAEPEPEKMCNASKASMASLYPADIVVQQIALGGCCVFLPTAASFKEAVRMCFLRCEQNSGCASSNLSNI